MVRFIIEWLDDFWNKETAICSEKKGFVCEMEKKCAEKYSFGS